MPKRLTRKEIPEKEHFCRKYQKNTEKLYYLFTYLFILLSILLLIYLSYEKKSPATTTTNRTQFLIKYRWRAGKCVPLSRRVRSTWCPQSTTEAHGDETSRWHSPESVPWLSRSQCSLEKVLKEQKAFWELGISLQFPLMASYLQTPLSLIFFSIGLMHQPF